ncbi:MAG TPA: NAD(P)/FAD-dependent oxidoreductase [Gracilimonas sp.]|uniref:phytoene desaturase family protein n=1 Tax=Gracilimonas sp. TaxID=1974203 RepID=UPI002D9CB220|nr:NAD(P)/FAD-dependent oxidoreductase [Gracilimonas sp.]
MKINQDYDAIIVGSGMGGMSAGAMLAKDGYKVLIIEKAHAPGGCSSSYLRKGYVFESGATTLIGFDEDQPLWKLEQETGIRIPREEITPSMSVWIDGEQVTRYKDREQWIQECARVFGNEDAQRAFWEEAFKVSDLVWKVSLKNPHFPPQKISEWGELFTNNNPLDAWVLKYAFQSVGDVMKKYGVDTPKFRRFVDEQLMITAQARSYETPFLFGAAGLTYTNYSNFYVPGGLLEMINAIRVFIQEKGGALHTKEGVQMIAKEGDQFTVHTQTTRKEKFAYRAPIVISNVPVWNMKDITAGEMSAYFNRKANDFDEAWGAITLGIATDDIYPKELPLHHQIHLEEGDTVPFTDSDSIFVSMSKPGDSVRAKEGMRTLNISTHASPECWYSMNGTYDAAKQQAEDFIVKVLRDKLPGFADAQIEVIHTATPVTWENWVYRKKGRVGGIPQSMARSLLKWTPSETPFKGLYLCGDTTYPGQGIPGVTLSGINVYSRIKKNHH